MFMATWVMQNHDLFTITPCCPFEKRQKIQLYRANIFFFEKNPHFYRIKKDNMAGFKNNDFVLPKYR